MDGFGDLWGWLSTPFQQMFQTGASSGSSGSAPSGYGNLTPDQQQLVQQQGWYPRPDMVMPTGSTLQQPAGYSNLTPAQASTVQGLGYYTPGQDQSQGGEQSLWSKIAKGLSSPGGESAIKDLQGAMAGPKPLPNQAPPGLLSRPAPAMNPRYNIYTPNPFYDPKQSLARFQRGY